MRNLYKIILTIMIIGTLAFAFAKDAYAVDKDTVVALGADLSANQRATVLQLMGLNEADLQNCTVIYITNQQEREYLGAYIDSSLIGTKSLTSVKMTKANPGEGINVTTQNVNYCTTGMYRNALLTAGVEDRNVLVVAPSSISGTAGLVGAVKAYEASSGENISDKTIDAALEEMITTGDISTQLEGVSNEDVEALIAWLKSMIATGQLDTSDEKSIRDAMDKGQKQFNVTLSDEEQNQIVSLLKKLDALGLNGKYLIGQAENLYSKYGSDIVNQASDVIGEAIDNAISEASKSFFQSIKESVGGFFSGLFKKK